MQGAPHPAMPLSYKGSSGVCILIASWQFTDNSHRTLPRSSRRPVKMHLHSVLQPERQATACSEMIKASVICLLPASPESIAQPTGLGGSCFPKGPWVVSGDVVALPAGLLTAGSQGAPSGALRTAKSLRPALTPFCVPFSFQQPPSVWRCF